ncbi:FkbM family methyltransferase [Dyella caseinilytica]|uniref:FkbM family methyltransferase n=1 Tax=Dyella caseinilytica TaxID=1849581 RepID=A0ABX7GSQ9_9GAMM|nr:FkbM family methyltransferase [Dyella caseinilytica]QRN53083.1 FkbM family methyltransferase [Dyella caseinilytica]GGA11319.1 hypothetical protein GCM10011408_35840 [Dyella caseinilytica]
MTMISYAQNYEDVMLVRALADISEGFYVDVGAQHPINGSVTKAFQLRGWRGVNIEPVDRWFRLICDDRPHDINLNTPISDVPGYIELFDVEDTGLSTVSQDYAERYSKDGWNVVKKRLKAHTLNAVFRAYAPKDVHFLKVDVEGSEAAVLRSLDLSRFRPWIILVEATKPNSQEPTFGEWEHLLLDASYLFAYDDGLNRFYVACEHEGRIKYFSRPPNFFDDFMLYSESWAREQMDRLSQEVEVERANGQRVREGHGAAIARAEHLANMQAEILNGLDDRLAVFGGYLDRMANRLDSAEAAIERVHERLNFAENVQVALVEAQKRERAVDTKLQQILHSRSWRITKGPRFIARVLRSAVRRDSSGDSELNKSTAIRLLVAATNRPVLRRIGSILLIATPGLKARLVRTVVSNARPAAPSAPSDMAPGGAMDLPGRAQTVRSMLDSAMKSS